MNEQLQLSQTPEPAAQEQPQIVVVEERETQIARLDADREAFLARLQQQARKYRRRYHSLYTVFWSLLLLFLLMRFGVDAGLIRRGGFIEHFLDALTLLYIPAMLGSNRAAKRWRTATAKLANSADVRFIGPLIELVVSPASSDKVDRSIVIDTLVELLPRLQASDNHLLNAEQRSALNRILEGRALISGQKGNTLRCAILKAYEQIGDGSALPVVERLANGAGTGKEPSVRDAAQECLPYLKRRAAQEIAERQLLRASDAAGTSSESLLRPAVATADTAPEQLLRPGILNQPEN